ncbi:V-type ATP synthase subunit D [Sporanaerobium hydrogeniformans]|uniref:V-type ATP synthase subunit D n=1 Tax=Sporanaerobium hydrogeniformans TaxID=3072179 RepID=A0AC61DGG2_9FIRM|nr:V-type ATP synthase subunit D [Sporanaerobium hydrogeniformans]PHV71960.1 V-type ATP synthase subunit D [Sporanaerobium hydrogeniformans]
MAELVAPTKSNLIKAKASLELSKKGFELLDKKRNVLIKEMMELVEKAKNVQSNIYTVIAEAYAALQNVNVTMGIKEVESITHSIPLNEEFSILLKSVMGVDIPTIRYSKSEVIPTYGFHNTSPAVDEAAKKFRDVRYMMYDLAEIDNSIFKLAKEIQKTQKRTNALQHIQIPKYKAQVKYIQEVLEEKEREDFFRLKRIKGRSN